MLGARLAPTSLRRTQATFAALMALASMIGLAKTAVFAKVLGVEDLGLYGLAVLVTQFGVHIGNWGILSALNNQLPMALGRGEERTPALVGRALGAVLIVSGLTGALYVLAVLALPSSSEVRLALVVGALLAVTTTLFEFALLLLRVERRLLPLASMYLVRAVFAVVLGAAAGTIWGFHGVIAVEVGVLLAVAVGARQRWLRTLHVTRPRLA